MGYLNKGQWVVGDFPIKSGAFVREAAGFRGKIDPLEIQEDPNRFELYVSYACPWAHRTLIFRELLGLESYIPVHVVDPYMSEEGWSFEKPEPNLGGSYLRDIYAVHQDYVGRVTVPILWDRKKQEIRNNESSEIIAMLNSCWRDVHPSSFNLIPEGQLDQIIELNEWIYQHINNAVYRTGFATEQEIYETECQALFQALDILDERLGKSEYLLGSEVLEPDIRLFVTLIRFDWVYVGHFKCNIRRIKDYPNLSLYVDKMHQLLSTTVNKDHIKQHYYMSHPKINPNQIIPLGPIDD